MDERTKLAFEFAREIATQLLTLSTAFLALTVTFTKELVKGSKGRQALYAAWVLQLVSVLGGVWTLMSLTGALARPAQGVIGPVFDVSVRLPAAVQVVMFVLSMAATVWYGYRAFTDERARRSDGSSVPE